MHANMEPKTVCDLTDRGLTQENGTACFKFSTLKAQLGSDTDTDSLLMLSSKLSPLTESA